MTRKNNAETESELTLTDTKLILVIKGLPKDAGSKARTALAIVVAHNALEEWAQRCTQSKDKLPLAEIAEKCTMHLGLKTYDVNETGKVFEGKKCKIVRGRLMDATFVPDHRVSEDLPGLAANGNWAAKNAMEDYNVDDAPFWYGKIGNLGYIIAAKDLVQLQWTT